jgi:hypothetical protein
VPKDVAFFEKNKNVVMLDGYIEILFKYNGTKERILSTLLNKDMVHSCACDKPNTKSCIFSQSKIKTKSRSRTFN